MIVDLHLWHSLWGVSHIFITLFRTGANHKVGLAVWDPSGWQVRPSYCQEILRESIAGMACTLIEHQFVGFMFFYGMCVLFIISPFEWGKRVQRGGGDWLPASQKYLQCSRPLVSLHSICCLNETVIWCLWHRRTFRTTLLRCWIVRFSFRFDVFTFMRTSVVDSEFKWTHQNVICVFL